MESWKELTSIHLSQDQEQPEILVGSENMLQDRMKNAIELEQELLIDKDFRDMQSSITILEKVGQGEEIHVKDQETQNLDPIKSKTFLNL